MERASLLPSFNFHHRATNVISRAISNSQRKPMLSLKSDSRIAQRFRSTQARCECGLHVSEDSAEQARSRLFELKRENAEKSLVARGLPEIHGIQSTGTEPLREDDWEKRTQ